ncbi:FGGY-family carbohydrate kinase [Arthrobacter sp. VKM Ac-2550]|uniref:FGGY-family carbohydrate kinase n=1 Tax=Crystallibacter permensis TaxID=1938888 RepID=UPI002226538A|nr:FGGY-family carbohydrate kinase [Arthrobacter sp. VKM Ac-2550]
MGGPVDKVILIGGGSKSRSLRQAAANIFGVPVEVPAAGEYVALGAARQAAWAVTGELPVWKPVTEAAFEPQAHSSWGSEVRGRYAEARQAAYGL